MISMLGYLTRMFMGIFWIFRLIVAFTFSMGIDFGIVPLNMNMEIVLLFITLICMLLVGKRKVTGAIIYLAIYGFYFGTDLYNGIISLTNGMSGMMNYTSLFISFVGIALPLFVLFEMLFDKNRKEHPVDKETDWYYKNKDYDRKYDERADRNNYRTL